MKRLIVHPFGHTARASLTVPMTGPVSMGRFLHSLLAEAPVYHVKREGDGYVLVGREERVADFSKVAPEAEDHVATISWCSR